MVKREKWMGDSVTRVCQACGAGRDRVVLDLLPPDIIRHF